MFCCIFLSFLFSIFFVIFLVFYVFVSFNFAFYRVTQERLKILTRCSLQQNWKTRQLTVLLLWTLMRMHSENLHTSILSLLILPILKTPHYSLPEVSLTCNWVVDILNRKKICSKIRIFSLAFFQEHSRGKQL